MAAPIGDEPSGGSGELLAGVSGAEERSEAACDCCDDEDRPELEADVDDLAGRRERILDRRRDSQQLYGREERSVAEAVDVATFVAALEYLDQDGADSEHDEDNPTARSNRASSRR